MAFTGVRAGTPADNAVLGPTSAVPPCGGGGEPRLVSAGVNVTAV
jgi:hypothetical protein